MKSAFRKILLLLMLFVAVFALASCEGFFDDDEPTIIVYYVIDGKTYTKEELEAGSISEEAPEKEGYVFSGWYLDEGTWLQPVDPDSLPEVAEGEEAPKLHAKFDLATYPITYDLAGGSQNTFNPTSYTINDKTLILYRPIYAGYVFDGWVDEDGNKVKTIPEGSSGPVKLTAKWVITASYTVKFNAGGGTGTMEDISLKFGEEGSLPLNTFKKTDCIFAGWKDEDGITYYDAGKIKKATSAGTEVVLTAQWRGSFGIDISNHQNKTTKIDFNMMDDNGVNYLILRASLTLIGEAGTGGTVKEVDESFEQFYKKAKDLKIPIGVYHYSCANTAAEGRAEAEFLYNNCLKGKQFEFPIFMDVENDTHQIAGKNGTTKAGVTAAINAFCEYLTEKGYYPAVYTYQSFIGNFDSEQITGKYDIWYAYYSSDNGTPQDTALNYKYGTFDMWQFSGKFKFKNSSSTTMNVDGDLVYKDYETFIKRFGLNGFNKADSSATFKTYAQLAKEVRAGTWGSTEAEQKYNLIAAGFDYNGVKDAVKYLPAT